MHLHVLLLIKLNKTVGYLRITGARSPLSAARFGSGIFDGPEWSYGRQIERLEHRF